MGLVMINHLMTNKLCLNCGKEFPVRRLKSAHVKGGGKFCSRSCVAQHNKTYNVRTCSKCKEEKSVSEFSKRNTQKSVDGIQPKCKLCTNLHRLANKKEINE